MKARAAILLVMAFSVAVVAASGCSKSDQPAGTTGTTKASGTTSPATSKAGTTSSSAGSTTTGKASTTTSSGASTTTAKASTTTSTVAGAPVIDFFTITPSSDVPCQGSAGAAKMAWKVTPVDVGISFDVDGQNAGAAQAGFTNEMSDMPLPINFVCDGKAHTVTLLATTGPGKTSQASVQVTTKL